MRQPYARRNNPQAAKACHACSFALQQDRKLQAWLGDGFQPNVLAQASLGKRPCRAASAQTSVQQTHPASSNGPALPAAQATSMPRPSVTFRVEVVVGSARLLVPCEEGERTVAWLLQQVQNRLPSSHRVCAAEQVLMGWLMAAPWLP